eukprot:COSAG05_NODE_439_length_9821_cov_110.691556_3_plen_256_part_00
MTTMAAACCLSSADAAALWLLLIIMMSGSSAIIAQEAEQCGGKTVAGNSTPFKLDGTFTFGAMPAPRLVPYPASLRASAAYLPLHNCSIGVDDPSLLPLAQLLSAEVLAATSGAVKLAVGIAPTARPSIILLSLSKKSSSGDGPEAYSLLSTAESATLISTTYAGMVSATATLLQAVELSGDYDAVPRTHANCTTAPEWRLPALNIHDAPALPYRGAALCTPTNPLHALQPCTWCSSTAMCSDTWATAISIRYCA